MWPTADGVLADRPVRVWLLCMAAVTGLYLAPTAEALDAVLFVGAHAAMVGVLVVGIRRNEPAGRSTWWFIVGGQVVYVAANLAWYVGPEILGWSLPFPSVADVLYLVAYASLGIGLWRLALRRSHARNGTVALEIATVTLGIGALMWLYLAEPIATDRGTALAIRLVALAYPAFDLALVSIVAALLLLPGRRPPAFWMLTTGLVAGAVADSIYAYTALEGTFSYGEPYFALWLLLYALFGAAVLHPSMRVLADPSEEQLEERPWWRTWVLPIALILPLVALALAELAGGRHEELPIPLAIAVAIVLVSIRQDRLLAELTDRQRREVELAASEEAARETSRMKSEFLATMSHEIRTPMNAVIGMSELLADTELDAEQRRYASGVATAGEALLALINDILDFSKIEAGELELEEVDFDLERQLEGVAELFTATAGGRGVDLYSYLHPDTPRLVRGDVGRLRQVLTNLVGNAVKFTEQGRVVVRAEGTPSDDGTVVRFEVTDTGIGISPEARTRLFEPFTQADASSTRRYGGTGLGLAICSQLVELMGGDIGVDSELGRGSTFWFTVPLRVTRERGVDRAVEPLRGARVLVVDDDATNREIVERQTAAWGMRPRVAASADVAMALLSHAVDVGDPFRVVLLDLHMPDVDGLALARRIRAELGDDVHVALLSSSSADLAAVRESGLAAELRKPVRQSELYDLLVGLLLPERGDDQRVAAGEEQAPDPELPSGTVLLVEDNPANQLVGSRIVEKLGYEVEIVDNGREALDALELRDYDAVLMDCQMPVMDGFEATRRLRERERDTTRHVPVVAMTASVTLEDRQRCVEAGMDDFVAKPVRPAAVEAVLRRWTSPRGATPAAAARAAGQVRPDAEPTAATSVVDADRWGVLVSLMRGRPELLDELVTGFVAAAPTRVEQLRRGVEAEDAAAVEAVAHSLKGVAANLGATRLAMAAGRVEDRAATGELDELAHLVEATDEELDRAIEELEARLVG